MIHSVSGGPGSGKITHSEVLSRRQKGFLHVNMTEMLQQVIDGTGDKDYKIVVQTVFNTLYFFRRVK